MMNDARTKGVPIQSAMFCDGKPEKLNLELNVETFLLHSLFGVRYSVFIEHRTRNIEYRLCPPARY